MFFRFERNLLDVETVSGVRPNAIRKDVLQLEAARPSKLDLYEVPFSTGPEIFPQC